MTTPPQRSARRAVVPLLRIVVAAQALRIVVAVIGGLVANREHLPGPDFGVHPAENGAEQLLQFASAGDGEGAILMVLGAVLLWLVAMLPRSERTWHGDFIATSVLLGLTSVSCVLTAVAYIWFASEPVGFPTSQEVQLVGFSIVYAALTAAMLYVVRRIHATVTSTAVDSGDEENDDEEGAAVFAVDRKTGAVLVWSSQAEARAKAPLFGIEDDEYEWFLDDGVMLVAAANGQDVSFTPTGEERPEDLLRHLKDYVERRGLRIDEEEADEPLAYVDPIARDHYLEMWPGWLRWLGRLTR